MASEFFKNSKPIVVGKAYGSSKSIFLNLFLLIGGAMELGEINSGEGSKNQQVEIQVVEGIVPYFIHLSFSGWGKQFLDFEVYRNDSSDSFRNSVTTKLRIFSAKMNEQTQFLEKFVDS